MEKVKHWQDAVNAVLGVWLVFSPWAAGFASVPVATDNALAIGLALVGLALGAFLAPQAWEEWTEAALGLWLIVSPWVLGFSGSSIASAVVVISGAVILMLASWTLLTDKDYSTCLRRLLMP
jgi:SPW repeat